MTTEPDDALSRLRPKAEVASSDRVLAADAYSIEPLAMLFFPVPPDVIPRALDKVSVPWMVRLPAFVCAPEPVLSLSEDMMMGVDPLYKAWVSSMWYNVPGSFDPRALKVAWVRYL